MVEDRGYLPGSSTDQKLNQAWNHSSIWYHTVLQFFNLQERQNYKYRVKMRCKSVEKYICIIYIKVNLQNFRLLQKEVNSKPLYKHKKGFAGYDVQVKLKPKV